jgi:hypothetical protein
VLLEEQLYKAVEELPRGPVRLKRATLEAGKEYLLLRRCAPTKGEGQALVHVCVAAGEKGQVFVSANAYDEVLERGRVGRAYKAFPGLGVQPLCTDTALEHARHGGEFLDLLVIMNQGSSFRVLRTGQLEGASPQLFVHWSGRELRCTVPGRYAEGRAAGFFEAASV